MLVNPQGTADSVTVIEETLEGKLHFLCSLESVRVLILYFLVSKKGTHNVAGLFK